VKDLSEESLPAMLEFLVWVFIMGDGLSTLVPAISSSGPLLEIHLM
jgi:hypothetical protein